MMSCNMPWWTIQSWVVRRNWNWQQTETCREDQAADCSRSLDPRRRNREAHSGPSESVERRGHSERQNADECDRMSPTLGCTCRPGTTAPYGADTYWPVSTTWSGCVCGLVASAGRHAECHCITINIVYTTVADDKWWRVLFPIACIANNLLYKPHYHVIHEIRHYVDQLL